MQRCMLDILTEVQVEVNRDRDIVWPFAGASPSSASEVAAEGDPLSGTAKHAASAADVAVATALEQVRSCLSTRSSALASTGGGDSSQAGSLKPLGRALRVGREEARQQEHRRLADALSARSGHSSCGYQPCSARRQAQRAPRLNSTPTGQRVGARAETASRVVHRHHHHHYHHHYVLDENSCIGSEGFPRSLCENTVETIEGHSSQCQAPEGIVNLSARQAGSSDPEVEHAHYHHHVCEEEIPPQAQRSLADAREAFLASAAQQRDGGDGGPGDNTAGLNVRLPRLA